MDMLQKAIDAKTGESGNVCLIVPRPAQMNFKSGRFVVDSAVKVEKKSCESLGKSVDLFCDIIDDIFKSCDCASSEPERASKQIVLECDEGVSGKSEAYVLKVEAESIRVCGSSAAGIFYGLQSLRQLVSFDDLDEVLFVPCVEIVDEPECGWRGLMLDCCRHFFTIDCIKKYVDLLAFYKLNRLHLHLTEDQGWRIEIKKYPKLTEVGSFRGESNYGGYYTLDELREIKDYAESRFVTVVPEIELPGHCQAALAAYPELSCVDGPFEVSERIHVIHEEAFCAGKEESFEFLENVFSEVIDALEPEYVHIGADECVKKRWENCSRCQQRMADEGLSDEKQLQAYFVKRIANFISEKGCKVIGWEEITEGGIDTGTIVQVWKGCEKKAIEALKAGHDVIMSPTSNCYLDYTLEKIDLERAWSFAPAAVDCSETKGVILGGEGCMWTEDTPQEKLDSKVFPRIVGLGEAMWTGSARGDYREFLKRYQSHYKALDRFGVSYDCTISDAGEKL